MPMDNQLPRSTPEAQGIGSPDILRFVEKIEQNICDLHSIMLLRHDHVVAEGWWLPYNPEYPHMLFSLSKSFTSSAVGLAVAEGRLSVNDPVLAFFPEAAPPEVNGNLAAMRVRHLLTMTTGHAEDTLPHLFECPDGDWLKAFLACPVTHEPGTHFVYNSGATYMLSAILQQLTGLTLLDYLKPRLFEPLGIRNPAWESCPRGINTGGWGLNIKTEDIAKFGQMYLQQGVWAGRQVLPQNWVEEATARQVSNGDAADSDWEQGYGYQFWRCCHDAYRGDGAFGQFCLVMPAQDAVLAITAGVADMQAVLNLIWQHLLPAFGPRPLPENSQAQEALAQKLKSLSLLPALGDHTSSLSAKVSGKTYVFDAADQEAVNYDEPNIESISVDFDEARSIFTLRDEKGIHRFAVGNGAWLEGTTTFLQKNRPRSVAASGAWIAEDTYLIKLCFYETPFCPTITCRFVEDSLLYDFKLNVSFGPTERPQLVGRLE